MKIFRYIVWTIEVLLIVALIYIAITTSGSDDFSGLAILFPLYGLAGVMVISEIVQFAYKFIHRNR